jgi:hypothetical protein
MRRTRSVPPRRVMIGALGLGVALGGAEQASSAAGTCESR